jgi:energy-converting hydrogenase B subunit E
VGGLIQNASFVTAGLLFTIGLWAVVFKDNLIKKVLGLTFITDAVNLTLVASGYKAGGIVPILLPGVESMEFASKAAYPLPMALVLTNIVISVATVSLILGLCVKLYHSNKTLSTRRIWKDGW